ncbi:hypothetical protein K402DRAFT_378801, partial [Aulographum hederae CBS 113979]
MSHKVDGMPKQLTDLMTGRVFEIVVGSGNKERTWTIHETLLCSQSKFFVKACKGDFKEAKGTRIILDDVEPPVFELFIQWLYTDTFEYRDLL